MNGGAVRDLYLGLEPNDYDLSLDINNEDLLAKCSNLDSKSIRKHITDRSGIKYGRVGVNFQDIQFDLICLRSEKYTLGSRKPEVSYGVTLLDDMLRRDFTVNANYLKIRNDGEQEVIFHHTALSDFHEKLIRHVGYPFVINTFVDDPLRILRALEIATRLKFSIHPSTVSLIEQDLSMLYTISYEKAYPLIEKILLNVRNSDDIDISQDVESLIHAALSVFIPELDAFNVAFFIYRASGGVPGVIRATVDAYIRPERKDVFTSILFRKYGRFFGVGKATIKDWHVQYNITYLEE